MNIKFSKKKALISVLSVSAICSIAFGSSKIKASSFFAYQNDSTWVHYSQKDATPTTKGIREYWVKCGGSYQFTKPSDSNIKEGTSYDTSLFTENDPRWIIYTSQTLFFDIANNKYCYNEAPDFSGVPLSAASSNPGDKINYAYVTSDSVPAKQVEIISATTVLSSIAEFETAKTNNTQSGTWSGYYVLSNDITMDQSTPYSSSVTSFNGVFDGRGHKISNGYFHSGTVNTLKNLFATNYGTVKNTAFVNTKIGILAGLFYSNNGIIDNCLFDGSKLGDYEETAIIYSAATSGKISNSIFYFDAPATKTKGVGAISMLQGTTENVLIFSNRAVNWDNRSSKTGLTIYSYNAALPTGLTGFNDYWDLSGTKASFKKVNDFNATSLDVPTQCIYKNSTDGETEIKFSTLGISGNLQEIYNSNKSSISFLKSSTGFTPLNVKGGEQSIFIKVDETYYTFKIKYITGLIRTAQELANFSSLDNTGYYILNNDIDASCYSSNSPFNKTDSTNSFFGTLDGNGHIIKGATYYNGGFIGKLEESGVVKNIGFVNSTCGYSSAGGIICKINYGKIDNCYIDVDAFGSDGHTYCQMSAICDLNYGTISNCVTDYGKNSDAVGKAICQYNYGNIENVYSFTTDDLLYDIPGNSSSSNLVSLNSTNKPVLTNSSSTGFDIMMWDFTTYNLPKFKGANKFSLTSNSLTDYSIIRGSDNTSIRAALALQTAFKTATGIELTILDKSEYASLTPHYISIGFTYQLNNNTSIWNMIGSGTTGEDLLGLGTSGYVIDTLNGNVYLTGYYKGDNLCGTENAVYDWLSRQFNLNIYSKDYQRIDTGCSNELLENIDVVKTFEIDSVIGGNSDSYGTTSMGFNTFNGSTGLLAGSYGKNIRPFHNFLDFLPQSVEQSAAGNPTGVSTSINYGETLGTAPKNNFNDGYTYYFDNAYSNRCVYDLCLGQKQDQLVEALLPRMYSMICFSGATHYNYICFCHEDGSFACPHCRKKYANSSALKSQYSSEQKYLTAMYVEFMIKLASAMKNDARFKNITLLAMNYGLFSDLPVSGSSNNYTLDSGISSYLSTNGLTIPDNLGVVYCYTLNNNYNGAIDTSVPQDGVNKWKTITNKFYYWTYIENYTNYFAPFDGLNQLQASMKFAKNNGGKVYYAQGMSAIGTRSIDWGALENFVMSELNKDVNQDVENLINKFMVGYYGSSATTMKQIYDLYKTKIATLYNSYGFGGTYTKLTDTKTGVNYISTTCWSEQTIKQFLDLFKTAYSQSTSTAITNAIKAEEAIYKYLLIKLYPTSALSYFGGSNISSLKSSFIQDCKDIGIEKASEGSSIDNLFSL